MNDSQDPALVADKAADEAHDDRAADSTGLGWPTSPAVEADSAPRDLGSGRERAEVWSGPGLGWPTGSDGLHHPVAQLDQEDSA